MTDAATDFLALQLAHAHSVYRARGTINPVIASAMAALESAWGSSELYVRARNPLGVKAGSSWSGPTMLLRTQEEEGGEMVPQTARWRVYPSLQAAYEDFASIVERLSWYQDAEDASAIPQDFLDGLISKRSELGDVVEPGWASDSKYRSKVWGIVVDSRVRAMYASLRRGQAPGGPNPPATTDPADPPAHGPVRTGRTYRAVVINAPYLEGEAEAFAEAARTGAPFIRRAPHVASVTESDAGPKLDIKVVGAGSSEVGTKGALESKGVWGGIASILPVLTLLVLPQLGIEIPEEVAAWLLGLAGVGGFGAIYGRATSKTQIKGLLSPRKERS